MENKVAATLLATFYFTRSVSRFYSCTCARAHTHAHTTTNTNTMTATATTPSLQVGWQIDAFGHNAGYTAMTASMGLQSMIGQKIDWQDHAQRAASKTLEFEWIADPNNQPNTSVFGHIMFDNTMGYSFTLPQRKTASCQIPYDNCSTIPLRTTNCTGGPPGGNGCCRVNCHSSCSSCAVELGVQAIASRVEKMITEYVARCVMPCTLLIAAHQTPRMYSKICGYRCQCLDLFFFSLGTRSCIGNDVCVRKKIELLINFAAPHCALMCLWLLQVPARCKPRAFRIWVGLPVSGRTCTVSCDGEVHGTRQCKPQPI